MKIQGTLGEVRVTSSDIRKFYKEQYGIEFENKKQFQNYYHLYMKQGKAL